MPHKSHSKANEPDCPDSQFNDRDENEKWILWLARNEWKKLMKIPCIRLPLVNFHCQLVARNSPMTCDSFRYPYSMPNIFVRVLLWWFVNCYSQHRSEAVYSETFSFLFWTKKKKNWLAVYLPLTQFSRSKNVKFYYYLSLHMDYRLPTNALYTKKIFKKWLCFTGLVICAFWWLKNKWTLQGLRLRANFSGTKFVLFVSVWYSVFSIKHLVWLYRWSISHIKHFKMVKI